MATIENLVIIGSGPAAWTAALYAARADLSPLVVEGEPEGIMLPGGQLMITTEVENYPGFPEGVTGPELMQRMKTQAERFGTRARMEMVERVDFSSRPFTLISRNGDEIRARAVIVATGANAQWLGIPNEERLAQSGGGVSACAVCDAALPIFREQVLAVVGGGDSAMEEALYASKFASKVYIIHRRDELRASRIMAERALANAKIEVLWNQMVVEVLGYDQITGLRLEDTGTGERTDLDVGGMFVAIGHTPNTAFLEGQLELTPKGYVRTGSWRTATSVDGVFAAGDVMDDYYRQAVTAAGTGCMAALEAERWLSHHGLGESPVLETADAPG
ncbi:MAG TPA: thioredoxin-disulfide reductase [Longimicrobiales bacterium]|nr:thioredoxin-disulfide reductase [Longimicrobiales bacterium]